MTSQVCESQDIIWCGRMYFTSENCDKTKLLPVIVVPITNDVSNADLTVMEVIKVVLPNSLQRGGTRAITKTQDSQSKEGWVTVTTKKGRQSISPGHYDPATKKTVSWNVTASEVDVETEIESLMVQGYYDIFNIVDLNEIALLAMHHMQITEIANVSAGIGGGFKKHQRAQCNGLQ